MKHPIQKVEIDKSGVFRFKPNEVVNFMVDKLSSFGFDLNDLHVECDKAEPGDWDQFNQLIGYSVSACPLSDFGVCDTAYSLYEKDVTLKNDDPNTVKEAFYEEKYTKLKDSLVEPMAELFSIHPDDLRENG